jgi:hypothetical protein
MTVVSLDMAYRSFREVLAGSTPASIRRHTDADLPRNFLGRAAFVVCPVTALASAAVHSNKKTVVYYELPRPTDIRRPPLAAVRNGHLATFPDADTRAAAGRRGMDRNRRREIITGVFRSA